MLLGFHQIDLIGFDKQLPEVDVVITGEGKTDWQSLQGKLLDEILNRTAASRTPVYCLCGKNAISDDELTAFPHAHVHGITRPDAMENAYEALQELAEQVVTRLGA